MRSSHIVAAALLTSLSWQAGCTSSKDTEETPRVGSQAETSAPAAPSVPDDAEVVAAIEANSGVTVRRSGANIVELNLLGLSPADNESLVEEFAWTAGLPALQTLIATGPGITDEAAAKLADHPSLSVIRFEKRSLVGDDGIAVISRLPRLTDISLERSEISNASLESLSQSDTILRIRAPRTKLSDEGVKHLANAPQLELLDLLEVTGISDTSLETIGKLQRMRNLRVYGSAITDEGMPHLAGLNNLAALGLQYAAVSDEGLKQLEGLKNLKEINLYGTLITDASLDTLAQMPVLAKARLRETGIRGEESEGFAKMQAMRDLDLSESPVQDAALEGIGQISGLRALNLWNTEVTDEGVAQLAGLKELTELNLDNVWDVTDASLDTIGNMSKLKLLHLGGTSITDEGLPKLHGLKDLRTLFLTRTEVSQEAYEQLKEQMPWVTRIEY